MPSPWLSERAKNAELAEQAFVYSAQVASSTAAYITTLIENETLKTNSFFRSAMDPFVSRLLVYSKIEGVLQQQLEARSSFQSTHSSSATVDGRNEDLFSALNLSINASQGKLRERVAQIPGDEIKSVYKTRLEALLNLVDILPVLLHSDLVVHLVAPVVGFISAMSEVRGQKPSLLPLQVMKSLFDDFQEIETHLRLTAIAIYQIPVEWNIPGKRPTLPLMPRIIPGRPLDKSDAAMRLDATMPKKPLWVGSP